MIEPQDILGIVEVIIFKPAEGQPVDEQWAKGVLLYSGPDDDNIRAACYGAAAQLTSANIAMNCADGYEATLDRVREAAMQVRRTKPFTGDDNE